MAVKDLYKYLLPEVVPGREPKGDYGQEKSGGPGPKVNNSGRTVGC